MYIYMRTTYLLIKNFNQWKQKKNNNFYDE